LHQIFACRKESMKRQGWWWRVLGHNTGGRAVMLQPIRFHCVRVWISTGLPCTDVSKTPDSFLNLKNNVPTMRHCLTDRHHVQWRLVFSWDGALVSATPHRGSGTVYQNKVCYSYTSWFPSAVSKDVMFLVTIICYCAVAYPGIFFVGGGSTNSLENRGQRERGSGGATVIWYKKFNFI
jgi:hypothetical protein